ncbi:DNA-dependent RNA polymerase subunit epsilon [Bacillus kexueae]|uniref:DNA-dependent RNA polymerase subunit epsilon n=1 Tax=Aeribacillus kexueae TaxID=2078952 RepID=UPI001FB02F65|nr:DNA-directed RNA polymerase subunit epsilon [Bacillus kexueae]
MMFKVFFQELAQEPPVRERTKSVFVEAQTEGEVRAKLKDHGYNIEFIQQVNDVFLEYEKQSENFKVLEI